MNTEHQTERLRLFARRHGGPLLGLVAVGLLAHGVTAAVRGGSGGEAGSEGWYPFLAVFTGIGNAFPRIASLEGAHLFATLMAITAGVFVHLGVFRVTQNRAVALGAGIVLTSHPAVVTMAGAADGTRDVLTMMFAAWAFCLHARPRHRSDRFPNRMPSPFTRGTLAVIVVAALSAPNAWIIPLLLVVQDLTFDRERGGEWHARDWKGYAPYGAVALVALVIGLFGAPGDAAVARIDAQRIATGVGGTMIATITPRFAETLAWPLALLVWLGVIGAVGVFALDQMFGIGLRKKIVQAVGFAGAWLVVAVIPAAMAGEATTAGNLGAGLIGFALLVPTTFWRFATLLAPGPAAGTAPPPRSWGEVREALAVPPLPSPEPSAPAAGPLHVDAATFSPALEVALERLGLAIERDGAHGAAGGFDRRVWERFIVPHAGSDDHVVEITGAGSPYSTRLASRSARATVFLEDAAGAGRILTDLDGVPDVELKTRGRTEPLPVADESIDLVVSVDRPAVGVDLGELGRTLRDGKAAVVAYPSASAASASADDAAAAGLVIEEVGAVAEGEACLVVFRKTGGAA